MLNLTIKNQMILLISGGSMQIQKFGVSVVFLKVKKKPTPLTMKKEIKEEFINTSNK